MKGRFNCPYCPWTGASDVMLARHQSMFHEALLASEGEKARERKSSAHFNPNRHNIVQEYRHKCDDGKIGKVYEDEILGSEGITRELRCVHCEKLLKTWFTEWTPEAKENYKRMKWGKYPIPPLPARLKEAIAKIAKEMPHETTPSKT